MEETTQVSIKENPLANHFPKTQNCVQNEVLFDPLELQIKRDTITVIQEHFPEHVPNELGSLGSIRPGNTATSVNFKISPICLEDFSEQDVTNSILDLKNNELTDPIQKVPLINNFQNGDSCSLPINFSNDQEEALHKQTYTEDVERIDLSSELENLDELLNSEIDPNESNLDLESELILESENSMNNPQKRSQLQINLERLNITNGSHKKAIENLAKLEIKVEKLKLRSFSDVDKKSHLKAKKDLPKLKIILNKINNLGITAQVGEKKPPKPLRPQHLKNVIVLEGKELDKKVYKGALKRRAKIHDKGNFLKYHCPSCSFKTWSFTGLTTHHHVHGRKLKYTFTCPDCDFTTSIRSTMTRHQQKHKKEPDLACPHCPYITRFDCSLRTHLRRWHLPASEAKTLNCPQCNFVSVCKTTYESHLMVHMTRGKNFLGRFLHNDNEEDVMQCEYCKFRTPNQKSLRIHMRETHKITEGLKNELFRCERCGFQTKHRFSYRDHLLIHTNVESTALLQCYDCGFKTKWKKYLVVHMRTDHSRRTKENKEKVNYQCDGCGKEYPEKSRLRVHIFKHHRESEILMCHYCSFTTTALSSLKRHTLVKHISPIKKTYQCQDCYYVSKDKASHKAHRRTHKYTCYICGSELGSKRTLADHLVGHMPEEKQKKLCKMFKCKICEYETRNKGRYDRHLRRWKH